MNNNLSRQLCELCGIEGKEGQPECLSIDTPVCKRGFTACCAENCTGCKYFNRFEKVYPDFTKPENFVRLFDLTLPQKGIPTIAEFVTYEHLTITDSKDFLAKLIEMLKDGSYVADIKQSIRETEWVYETKNT